MKKTSLTTLILVGLLLFVATFFVPHDQQASFDTWWQTAIHLFTKGIEAAKTAIDTKAIPTRPPASTPTALPPAPIPELPAEAIQAFTSYMDATYGGIFYGGRPSDSMVTDPAATSYPTKDGAAYTIPDESPPIQTQFCLDNYGQWTDFPDVFAWCPIYVEAFRQHGLNPSPHTGINTHTLSLAKIFAQTTQESGGNNHVVSYAGAAGRGQIMPSNGFIDLSYANSCSKGSCIKGQVNPPDTPESRQAYIDFYSLCSGYEWGYYTNKYVFEHDNKDSTSCNESHFQFWNRPTIEELFSPRQNIFWMVEHMNDLTTNNGYIAALQIYYQGGQGDAPEYTNPICSILASHSQETCY